MADPEYDGRQYKRVGASHLIQLPTTTVSVATKKMSGDISILFIKNPAGIRFLLICEISQINMAFSINLQNFAN